MSERDLKITLQELLDSSFDSINGIHQAVKALGEISESIQDADTKSKVEHISNSLLDVSGKQIQTVSSFLDGLSKQ